MKYEQTSAISKLVQWLNRFAFGTPEDAPTLGMLSLPQSYLDSDAGTQHDAWFEALNQADIIEEAELSYESVTGADEDTGVDDDAGVDHDAGMDDNDQGDNDHHAGFDEYTSGRVGGDIGNDMSEDDDQGTGGAGSPLSSRTPSTRSVSPAEAAARCARWAAAPLPPGTTSTVAPSSHPPPRAATMDKLVRVNAIPFLRLPPVPTQSHASFVHPQQVQRHVPLVAPRPTRASTRAGAGAVTANVVVPDARPLPPRPRAVRKKGKAPAVQMADQDTNVDVDTLSVSTGVQEGTSRGTRKSTRTHAK